jgi:hypothetical protein
MSFKNIAIIVLSALVIISCEKPEEVTESFVKAMATGMCDEALLISTGQARDAVLGAKEAGCETYKSEIIGKITCEINGDVAVCSCTEKRELPGVEDITFIYNLEKEGSDWKVSSYTKDNPLTESSEGNSSTESIEE